jgi:hypothetical protein
MERDIVLLLVGGLIGAVSSLATLFVVYLIEGMRLRRKWAREDQLQLRQQRQELQALLAGTKPAGTIDRGQPDV